VVDQFRACTVDVQLATGEPASIRMRADGENVDGYARGGARGSGDGAGMIVSGAPVAARGAFQRTTFGRGSSGANAGSGGKPV
jgi:hypothetical protein